METAKVKCKICGKEAEVHISNYISTERIGYSCLGGCEIKEVIIKSLEEINEQMVYPSN